MKMKNMGIILLITFISQKGWSYNEPTLICDIGDSQVLKVRDLPRKISINSRGKEKYESTLSLKNIATSKKLEIGSRLGELALNETSYPGVAGLALESGRLLDSFSYNDPKRSEYLSKNLYFDEKGEIYLTYYYLDRGVYNRTTPLLLGKLKILKNVTITEQLHTVRNVAEVDFSFKRNNTEYKLKSTCLFRFH